MMGVTFDRLPYDEWLMVGSRALCTGHAVGTGTVFDACSNLYDCPLARALVG